MTRFNSETKTLALEIRKKKTNTMKNHSTRFLAAAAALAVVTSATAATYNGDLFVGFTAQSGNDVIFDLGQAATLYSGQNWDLSAAFTAAGFASPGSLKWGILGDKNVAGVHFAWSTTGGATPLTIPNTPVWGTLDTPTRSIASQFSLLGSGQYVTPLASFDNSWNQQTIVGTLTTQYHNTYENPNVVGFTSASFYSLVADDSAPTLQGTFSLSANNLVTFTAVPEPGSLAFLGLGLGMAILAFRRPSVRNV